MNLKDAGVKDDITYFKGFTLEDFIEVTNTFVKISRWSSGGRRVFVSNSLLSILTLVEGDIYLEVCLTRSRFLERYNEIDVFYAQGY